MANQTLPLQATQELLTLAKEKARNLTQPNTQIRLTGDEYSYWLFHFQGKHYIGREAKDGDNVKRFFKRDELKLGTEGQAPDYYVQQFNPYQ